MKKLVLTECLIETGGRILLGKKKRGFGAGKWYGFGGKQEPMETIEQTCARELMEEARIRPINPEKRAIIQFIYLEKDLHLEVHFFHCSKYSGQPKETREMAPKWFNQSEIPYEEMWPDYPYWMPVFLKGATFTGTFEFADDKTISAFTLDEVTEL